MARRVADLTAWCREHDLALHVFAWRPRFGEAGLVKDALYLLRPDTYVALAERSPSVDTLVRYFDRRAIRIGPFGQAKSRPPAY